jgi:hypothetical protein
MPPVVVFEEDNYMLERHIIQEFFEDPQFSSLLPEIRYEMKFDSLVEWIPTKWGFVEERLDMEKDSLKRISLLKKDTEFVVNVTGEEDTSFIFFIVRREYADLFTWVLDRIDPQWWSPIRDFHPEDYDQYNINVNEKDEYMH